MKNVELQSLGLMELDAREICEIDGGSIIVTWGRDAAINAFSNSLDVLHGIGDFFQGVTDGLKEASRYR